MLGFGDFVDIYEIRDTFGMMIFVCRTSIFADAGFATLILKFAIIG